MKGLGEEEGRLWEALSEQDFAAFFDRQKAFGEMETIRRA